MELNLLWICVDRIKSKRCNFILRGKVKKMCKNTNKDRVSSLVLIFVVFFGVNSCGSQGGDSKQKANPQVTAHEAKLSQYFSANKPGKWKDLLDEHSPTVNIIKKSKTIRLVVSPPFAGKPEHYIELIVLSDYALNEIDKVSFPRGVTPKSTSFSLPPKSKGEYYIIQKCNLHDMWYKKVLIN